MKSLYLECSSGISGDMLVAALLDAGADEAVLRRAIASLPLTGFEIEISRVVKSGLDVCDFNVKLDAEHENHDHDMAYLYGHAHGAEHAAEHVHAHGAGHAAEHVHTHGTELAAEYVHTHGAEPAAEHVHTHGAEHAAEHVHAHAAEHTNEEHHHHTHRGLKEITDIIEHSGMTRRAKDTALRIFHILGEAEAKAHGTTLEQVHFHEVGAVDSIVDIAAAAVCLDNLDADAVIIPRLCEGSGTVRCQHGILPVPVPAVANIAAQYGLLLHMTGVQGELVTPTGAAIAAAVGTSRELPAQFRILRTGMGAGKRQYALPGILRAMLLESDEKNGGVCSGVREICKLETNIDDCSGETLGYVMERLLAAGAKDVNYTPLFMKKNRPAYQLNVICAETDAEKLEQIVFEETTTIGIRRILCARSELARREETVQTPYGAAQVKICTLKDGQVRVYPEYESIAALAKKNEKPFREVFRAAEQAGYELPGL